DPGPGGRAYRVVPWGAGAAGGAGGCAGRARVSRVSAAPVVACGDGAAGGSAARVDAVAAVGGRTGGNGWSHAIAAAGAGDRKSTRLNSSHVKISYAVFCLKKKKNQ